MVASEIIGCESPSLSIGTNFNNTTMGALINLFHNTKVSFYGMYRFDCIFGHVVQTDCGFEAVNYSEGLDDDIYHTSSLADAMDYIYN
jgi:hypothetical protein